MSGERWGGYFHATPAGIYQTNNPEYTPAGSAMGKLLTAHIK